MVEKDYIWTNHARSAVVSRKIPKSYIDSVLYSPDQTLPNKKGGFEQTKRIDDRVVTALIKQSEKGDFIIITAWVNPPFSGTKDAKKRARYLQYQKAGIMKKIWLTLLDGLGL